jgi:hypothetical protein
VYAVLALPSATLAAEPRAVAALPAAAGSIQLHLSPRICTLAAGDKQCQTEVHASWSATADQSLCLVVLEKPEIKRCWENFCEGTYTRELVFADDLTFQLRDPELRQILSSEVLRVIREAIRYRHKRRDPWNVFE